jgi:hypothetical protein
MTIGQLKTYFEKRFTESYQDEKEFKQVLKEFKTIVLKNKSISKAYNVYDELSTPQGINESETIDYINEGLRMISSDIKKQKLPQIKITENSYSNLDELIYNNGLGLSEVFKLKKEISKVLSTNKKELKESVKIPVSSMIKIANQTLNGYLETLDESSKKELLQLVKEDRKLSESNFIGLKESTISKLTIIKDGEKKSSTSEKIEETINAIKNQEFNQLNYFKLKKLNETL